MASLDIVIRSEALSKSYVLGARVDRGKTFRDTLAGAASGAVARLRAGGRGTRKREREVVWALRDVSFEVERGRGRRHHRPQRRRQEHAAEDPLARSPSRAPDAPTSVDGVGSLLEVGTGFHRELTGRENVYLNGAILGMRRAEIDRRFDEIVAFAEVERFLDTPVKRYSSGMYVRLAFAVAAHLEPEILLVDEVLAVGDVGFQRKCIGKMSEVAGEGRTVLFVSHNMATMQALCRRGIFLEGGRVHTDGSIVEAVTGYLRSVEQAGTIDLEQRTDRRGWHEVVLSSVEITGAQHDELLATGRPARFSFRTKLRGGDDSGRLSCTFVIVNHLGQAVTTLAQRRARPERPRGPGPAGDVRLRDRRAATRSRPLPGRRRDPGPLVPPGRDRGRRGLRRRAGHARRAGRSPAARAGDVAVAHRWIVPSLD